MEFHVGRGSSRGALTVFPLWGVYAGPRGYILNANGASLSEREDGPVVGWLVASNPAARPLLLLEGTLFEGGWQNRMLTRSVLVPAGESLDLEVACVEAGRWGGGERHGSTGRRASMRVRNIDRDGPESGDQQGEVWRRVTEFDARYGVNETSSLTVHVDRAASGVQDLVDGLRPLPGQVGVLIGIAGQPVMLEAFDSPTTLRQEFRSMVSAAALDAVGREPVRTPARRAIRFVDRAALVGRQPVAAAGVGTSVVGSSPYATVAGLAWRRRLVHLNATNPRHLLNV